MTSKSCQITKTLYTDSSCTTVKTAESVIFIPELNKCTDIGGAGHMLKTTCTPSVAYIQVFKGDTTCKNFLRDVDTWKGKGVCSQMGSASSMPG